MGNLFCSCLKANSRREKKKSLVNKEKNPKSESCDSDTKPAIAKSDSGSDPKSESGSDSRPGSDRNNSESEDLVSTAAQEFMSTAVSTVSTAYSYYTAHADKLKAKMSGKITKDDVADSTSCMKDVKTEEVTSKVDAKLVSHFANYGDITGEN